MRSPDFFVGGSEAQLEKQESVIDGAELDPRLKGISFTIQRYTKGTERTIGVPVPVDQDAPDWALACNGAFPLGPQESWEEALEDIKAIFKQRLDDRGVFEKTGA